MNRVPQHLATAEACLRQGDAAGARRWIVAAREAYEDQHSSMEMILLERAHVSYPRGSETEDADFLMEITKVTGEFAMEMMKGWREYVGPTEGIDAETQLQLKKLAMRFKVSAYQVLFSKLGAVALLGIQWVDSNLQKTDLDAD